MADKSKDAKKDDARMSSIAKTLNKVEDRLEKSENCDSVAEGLANAAKASELLSSVWTLPPTQLLRFHHDTKVSDIDGDSTPGFDGNKDDAERFISISSSEIARYQRLMYANGVKGSHRRLLIVLQGMDASGKGGIVRHVFSQGDPMGMHYHGFGAPKGEELDHDYLWRIKRELPNNGWISIFDRSHYEDIVMPRIYKTQPEEVWQARYDEINRFESQLTADGCAIIKIFLVVSKDVSMIRPNAGSSIRATLRRAPTGTTTWLHGRMCSCAPAPSRRRGIWCLPTIVGIRGPSSPSCCATRSRT